MDIEISFNNEWLPIMREHVLAFKFKDFVQIDDIDLLIPPSTAKKILILNRDNYAGTLQYSDQGIVMIDQILARIDQELPSEIHSITKDGIK
jgi:hypothetical protein